MSAALLPAETDVFVVGGGPAGLAAALAVRLAGFDVIVADQARPPIDKACGEGLMPGGVSALRAIGVDLSRAQALRFRGIRFLDRELEAKACFPSDSFGFGIRRIQLHRILLERATQAGVITSWHPGWRALIIRGSWSTAERFAAGGSSALMDFIRMCDDGPGSNQRGAARAGPGYASIFAFAHGQILSKSIGAIIARPM